MGVWTSTSMHPFPKYNIRETLASLFDHGLYINIGGLNNLLLGSAQIIFGRMAIISLRTKVHTTALDEMQLLPLTVEPFPNSLFMKHKKSKSGLIIRI